MKKRAMGICVVAIVATGAILVVSWVDKEFGKSRSRSNLSNIDRVAAFEVVLRQQEQALNTRDAMLFMQTVADSAPRRDVVQRWIDNVARVHGGQYEITPTCWADNVAVGDIKVVTGRTTLIGPYEVTFVFEYGAWKARTVDVGKMRRLIDNPVAAK